MFLRNFFLLTLSIVFAGPVLAAHETKVDVQRGEHWWGIFIGSGTAMPLTGAFEEIDLASRAYYHTTPFMVSSRGRYIWSAEPFRISFTGDAFHIKSDYEEVKAVNGGRNLREAYLVCTHKNFPPTGKTPALELFTRPVYDPTVETGFDPDERALLRYADQILEAGYPAGTIILPAGWQLSTGSFEPDHHLYPDFAATLKSLHDKGFKVMLTVTPYLSGDGRLFRQYREERILKDGLDRPMLTDWAGGYSAIYDLTDPEVYTFFEQQLESLKRDYGVDGYYFDCSAMLHLLQYNYADRFLEQWTKLGKGYDFCQYTVSQGAGSAPFIHTFETNVPYDWDFLKRSCSDQINANLLGYPYVVLQPAYDDVSADFVKENETLFLRGIQLSSVLPVMMVKYAPWKIGNRTIAEACKTVVNQRVALAEYYEKVITESAKTAEPLMRHMDYEFPRNGFTDCDDQFMIGSKYLVAPLLGEENNRIVRFPKGNWLDMNGKRYRGPLVTQIASADGKMLIFESAAK